MPISELERLRVGAVLTTYCQKRVSRGARRRLRVDYRFEGNSVVLFEGRRSGAKTARWRNRVVAKFRYLVGKRLWALYWLDSRGRWQKYKDTGETSRLKSLVAEVERDPKEVFWKK